MKGVLKTKFLVRKNMCYANNEKTLWKMACSSLELE